MNSDWFDRIAIALSTDQDESVAGPTLPRQALGLLGRVPERVRLTVVHDWHVRTVLPMLQERSANRGLAVGASYEAVRQLHLRSHEGRLGSESEWRDALRPMLLDVYMNAYPLAEFYAQTYEKAYKQGTSDGLTTELARDFAERGARRITNVDARRFAETNASANTRFLAAAYAHADSRIYADNYPAAQAKAYVESYVNQAPAGDVRELRQDCRSRLLDGLLTSVMRSADEDS